MRHKIPLRIVTIDEDGLHVFVDVLINGIPAVFVVDTGASRTVLDSKRISRFMKEEDAQFVEYGRPATGLGSNHMETRLLKIDLLKIGSFECPDYETAVVDMSHVNIGYHSMNMPPVDGALGSDILLKSQATVDYRKSRLVMRTKKNEK
jgi:predicted aspartyl protease